MELQSQLDYIFKGMDVYGADANRIGSVDYVYFGSDTAVDTVPELETLKAELTEALGGFKAFPPPVYSRLHRYGFIRIRRGFLRSDVIVVPQQIANVEDDSVYLNVDNDSLLKG
jgi:hypothetical protein